jgi:hypothetical protein
MKPLVFAALLVIMVGAYILLVVAAEPVSAPIPQIDPIRAK